MNQQGEVLEDEVIESEGERFVYLVRSRTYQSRRYRCDLTFGGGYGRCACKDWETRRGPAAKDGAPMGTRATLCYHLIVARRYFLNGLLSRLADEETAGI